MLGFRGVQSDSRTSAKIRPWQRALVPLHLHARQIVIPGLDNGKNAEIKAPLPPHFQYHMQLLRLIARKKGSEEITRQSYYERQLYKLQRTANLPDN